KLCREVSAVQRDPVRALRRGIVARAQRPQPAVAVRRAIAGGATVPVQVLTAFGGCEVTGDPRLCDADQPVGVERVHTHRAVVTGTGHAGAIGAESDAVDGGGVSGQGENRPVGARVPDPDGLVLTAGGKQLPSGLNCTDWTLAAPGSFAARVPSLVLQRVTPVDPDAATRLPSGLKATPLPPPLTTMREKISRPSATLQTCNRPASVMPPRWVPSGLKVTCRTASYLP